MITWSAYAHNDDALVREQQEVTGQKSPPMGSTGTSSTRFSILKFATRGNL